MQKKVIQKRNILIVVALILIGLVFVSGVLAAAIGDFKHYEDIAQEWTADQINAIQSGYMEDEVLPHFAQYNELTIGTTYYFFIYMDSYLQTTNACGFDALNDYDATTRLIPISTTGITPSGPIVMDAAFPGDVGSGNLYSSGTDVLSTEIQLAADSGTGGNVQTNILIQFKASATTADFWWGQHIAIPGACDGRYDSDGLLIENSNGASDWTGGGLRTKLQNADGAGWFPIPPITPLPESGAIQIMPSAIRPPTFEGYKWFDTDGDGIWDAGEYPLQYWEIYLQGCIDATPDNCSNFNPDITYTTGVNGYYALSVPADEFNNVLPGYYRVCENLDGQNPKWENTHPDPYATTNPVCHPVEYIATNADNFSDVNFGNWWGTTAVELSGFTANHDNDNKVALLVEWQTALQTDTLGFNLYRSRYEDGSKRKLLAYLDLEFDGEYEYLDKKVGRGKTYYYWLEAFYIGGSTEEFGPIEGTVPKRSK